MTDNVDVQPHNIQAEEATLGSCLIDPDAILAVRAIIKPRDFYISRHQLVYAAYLAAIDAGNEAPTYIELCETLERQGKLEDVGVAAFITSLINKTPTAMNAMHYARIVAHTGYLRRAIAAAQKIARIAYQDDEDSVDSKQEQIERIVFDLAPTNEGEGLEHISVPVDELEAEMARREKGELPSAIPTGFIEMDKLLEGGLQQSDLIIIAARPSMGKTALMLDIARNAAHKYHKNVAVFSLEMSKAQIVRRLVTSRSGIDSKTFRVGKLAERDCPMFIQVTGEMRNSGIYIDDRGNQSTSQMRAKLRRLMAQTDIDLIIIDYLQLMRTDRRTSGLYEKTATLSRDLKAFAKEFDVPVVVGSQLSRKCEDRNDKRPMMSDLRDSGTIEEDADIVAFIYRDEYYDPLTDQPNVAEINLAKHRNGPTGMFPLFFKKGSATFRNIELGEVAL